MKFENFNQETSDRIDSVTSSPTNISRDIFDAWVNEGRALEPKHGYPSVIFLPDETVIKVWAKRSGIFSSGFWSPYSNRFVRHAAALKKLGIPVPEIISHGRLKNSHVRIVRYRSLPGESIRSLLHRDPSSIDIPALARFYRKLHDLGIDFRGGHFGNIIRISPGNFGLIDFTSMKIYPEPLTPEQRARNLERPFSYEKDAAALYQAGLPELRLSYHDSILPDERDLT